MPVSDSGEQCYIYKILAYLLYLNFSHFNTSEDNSRIQILSATTSCWFSLNIAKGFPAWKYQMTLKHMPKNGLLFVAIIFDFNFLILTLTSK